MGSMTIGFMLGVRVPEGVELRDEESDSPTGLLDLYEDTPIAVESQDVPVEAWEADPPAVGFWIAVGVEGSSGSDHVPPLPSLAAPLRLVREDELYADSYKAARQRWGRFTRWARSRGVELGKPRLMRVDTEVA